MMLVCKLVGKLFVFQIIYIHVYNHLSLSIRIKLNFFGTIIIAA